MIALRVPNAIVAAAICAGTAQAAPQARSVPSPLSVPAIGRDWMETPGVIDRLDDPNPWPRADAADAGLDDMIHDERQTVGGAVAGTRPAEGLITPNHVDEHLLRTLRKVGGDYVVVPLLTLHLDRGVTDR